MDVATKSALLDTALRRTSEPADPIGESLRLMARASVRMRESIDLFAGAGGLSIGLHAAGFRPVAAVEIDVDCCETYRARFPNGLLYDRSIEDVDLARFEGIDLVAGGPPCQPFSSGGKGLAAEDPRDMIPAFVRAVEVVRPQAFIMENVPGLFGVSHRDYLLRVLRAFHRFDYTPYIEVVNAADFGVPQRRRRGFVVGLRKGVFAFPPPTHGPHSPAPYMPSGAFIAADKIYGEPNPSGVFYAKRPDLRPSPYDGQLFNGGGRPINLGGTAPTILASAGGNKTHFIDVLGLVPPYHAHLRAGGRPKKGRLPGARRLTVAESAALQTFPRRMTFSGSRSSQYMQIGNAVPPLLAMKLGHALYAALTERAADRQAVQHSRSPDQLWAGNAPEVRENASTPQLDAVCRARRRRLRRTP